MPVSDTDSVPGDFENPDWKNTDIVHDWKNHVDEFVREIWDTFTDRQKAVLARGFQIKADNEDWD